MWMNPIWSNEVEMEMGPKRATQPTEPQPSMVDHPPHYTAGDIECIDAIKAALGDGFRAYCKGNAIKYIWREAHKGGNEDLRKARWYLDRLLG